jgi:1,4-dihydroxy-6-naphthoate synthase
MSNLSLGYSPCPNDTFIFYALIHNKIDTEGIDIKERLFDVERLNTLALRGEFDITKVSYGAYPFISKDYCLIRSGGAMGRGCGPLLVAREKIPVSALRGKTIAIPGELTTAFMLLRLYDPILGKNFKAMRFDKIMPAVRDKEVEAGLIIHEGRFTYQDYGLKEIVDLGKWWEDEKKLPIPLGAIAVKRALGRELIKKIESLIRKSVLYSMENPKEPIDYIKLHAQELSEDVIYRHINLYVNNYSVDISDEGIRAVETLLKCSGPLAPEIDIFI